MNSSTEIFEEHSDSDGSSVGSSSYLFIKSPPEDSSALESNSKLIKKKRSRGPDIALPAETEKAIIESIVSTRRHIKFQQVCEENTRVFGIRGSDFRRAVQRRRDKLVQLRRGTDHKKFFDLCESLSLTQEKTTEDDKEKSIIATPEISSFNNKMSHKKHIATSSFGGGSK